MCEDVEVHVGVVYTCVMIVDEGHVIGWHVCEGDVCGM